MFKGDGRSTACAAPNFYTKTFREERLPLTVALPYLLRPSMNSFREGNCQDRKPTAQESSARRSGTPAVVGHLERSDTEDERPPRFIIQLMRQYSYI